MKYVAICAQGMEDVTQKEIKEILNVDASVLIPGRVVFESEDIETFISKTRSTIKVYTLMQECKDVKEIKVFEVKEPFRVRCSRRGEHEFSSISVEKEVGALFHKEGYAVDLQNPETIVFVDIVDNNVFVGIDLTPILLSKREYRIKTHNQSINACIAYGLVRLADFNEEQVLLDPFPKDGVIAIEAALFAKGKVCAFAELFPTIRNIEINAKLAGVRKDITLSRTELEWFDTKLEEGEVDCVVTSIPFPSKMVSEKNVEKIYKEFWHQMNYVLHTNGKVVLISQKSELIKKSCEHFKLVDERIVATSSLKYSVLVFEK